MSAEDQVVQLHRRLVMVALALLTLFWTPPVKAATPVFDLEVDSEGSSVEVTLRFQQTISAVEQFEASGVLDLVHLIGWPGHWLALTS